jgi:hypothetical protein
MEGDDRSMNHMKGQWIVETGHRGPQEKPFIEILQDTPGSQIVIADIPYHLGIKDIGKSEEMDNARLIAAAPDLFNACLTAMHCLTYESWSMAVAAVEKASGRKWDDENKELIDL